MRLVGTDKVQPGMTVAKNVFLNGDLWLAKGVKLTASLIDRLKRHGFLSVYVETTKEIEPLPDLIREEIREEAIKAAERVWNSVKIGGTFDLAEIRDTVEGVLHEVLSNPNLFVSLSDPRTLTRYTVAHMVNVTVLAVMVGVELGYDRAGLLDLGLGTAVHDIGKARLPEAILDKPGPLDKAERESMDRHPEMGLDLLRELPDLTNRSLAVVYQHHERFDGSGYPRGLKGEEIHEYARIVAVCDTYDAMTSDRVYRRRYEPCEALEVLTKGRGTTFDPLVVDAFTRRVIPYPPGVTVELSSGAAAVVLRSDPRALDRPVVKLFDPQPQPGPEPDRRHPGMHNSVCQLAGRDVPIRAEGGPVIELTKEPNLHVTRVLPLLPDILELTA